MSQQNEKALLSSARRTMSRSLNEAERFALNNPQGLRYDSPIMLHAKAEAAKLFPSWICCHKVIRTEPCRFCGRTEEDCQGYRVAFQKAVERLLATL